MADFSVLVPWRSDSGERERIWQWVKARWEIQFPNAEIITADSGDVEFSRGKSRNQAAEQASTDLFIIADADTFVPPESIHWGLISAVGGDWGICYESGNYYNASKELTEKILTLDPDTDVPEPVEGEYEFKLISTCGMLFMPREGFEKSTGYDDRYIGWGWEDDSFRILMQQRYKQRMLRAPGYAIHLYHTVTEKDRFEQPNIELNRSLYEMTKRQYGVV